MKKRALIWQHFTEVKGTEESGAEAACNYCGTVYKADSRINGTSNMKAHLSKCSKYEHSELNKPDLKQSELSLQPVSSDQAVSDLKPWKYEEMACRKALAQMIIACELPFRVVENEKFKRLCHALQARFYVPSRFTIARDWREI